MKRIKKHHIRHIGLTMLMLLSLGIVTAAAAKAAGLPQLEDGYSYYCVGEQKNDAYKTQNAILFLKLHRSDIDKNPPTCVTDQVDLNFLQQRFLIENDPVLGESVLDFRAAVELEDEVFDLRFYTISFDSYAQKGKDYGYKLGKKGCGISKNPDEYGLYPSLFKFEICKSRDFISYGFLNDKKDIISVRCFPKRANKKCHYRFYYNNWHFVIFNYPMPKLHGWREHYRKFVEVIGSRVVQYYAPGDCFGPLCDEIKRHIEPKFD